MSTSQCRLFAPVEQGRAELNERPGGGASTSSASPFPGPACRPFLAASRARANRRPLRLAESFKSRPLARMLDENQKLAKRERRRQDNRPGALEFPARTRAPRPRVGPLLILGWPAARSPAHSLAWPH